MWRCAGRKNYIKDVLWQFLQKLATFLNVTKLCMSPLTQVLVWRLAVASQLKYNTCPEYVPETQGWNGVFPANAAVPRVWKLGPQGKPFWCRRSKDWKRGREMETGKSKAREDLAWADKETRTKSWVGGSGEVTWELWKQSECSGGAEEACFLRQWSGSQDWLGEMRMRSPGGGRKDWR